MGGGNPVKGLTSVVRGFGRAAKDNPEKALFQTAIGATIGGPLGIGAGIGAANVGVENETKRQEKKLAGTQAEAQAKAQKDAEALAIANESVRAQKEKARKRTLFAGLQDQLGSQTTLG